MASSARIGAALRVGAPLRSARSRTSHPNRTPRATPAGSYDGEVAWSDELVGRLDAVLAETGLRDDTLFVVTADHGEGLDEHGEAVHGFFVYETTLHVPLIVRGPRVTPGTRIESVTRSIDVMPTVLDLLGLADATPAVSGRSLAPALAGKTIDRRADVRRIAHAADPLRVERPPGRCATAGGSTFWRLVPSCTTSIGTPAN